jgi:hypothetical protein
LAFGQAAADSDDDFDIEDAEGFAQDSAMLAMRLYCGESLSCSRDSEKSQSLTKYADGSSDYTNTSKRLAKIRSEADALRLPGMVPIYTETLQHPLMASSPTVVCVYEYKLSAARELADLAKEFGLTAGSRGGGGVTGTKAAEKTEDAKGAKGGTLGGNSGSSSAADDDDV